MIADEPSVVYTLSQADLEGIEKNDPETAYVFHRIVVHLMGERMTHLIKVVNAMQDKIFGCKEEYLTSETAYAIT